MKNESKISIDRLHELFSYCPESGSIFRKISYGPTKAGSIAGEVTDKGYVRITVDGVRMYAHRIVWALVNGSWPVKFLDHIDGEKANNRIHNLRLADVFENARNKPARRGRTGLSGVRPKRGKFEARIKKNGKERHLGSFSTVEEAHEVYCLASEMLFGDFSNHSFR